MGMYTEILMRGEIRKDAPDDVRAVLRYLVRGEEKPETLPEHPFFKCERWEYVATMNSAYLPVVSRSSLEKSGWGDSEYLYVHAQLKDYDGEIEKFFDWVDPYIDGTPDQFLGYSLYEEDEVPRLFHKRERSDAGNG